MLSHQQIMSRRAPVPTNSSSSSSFQQSGDKSDAFHQKITSQISAIHSESGDAGLLHTLQALTNNIREVTSSQNDDTKKNLKNIFRKALGGGANDTATSNEGNPFESTPSSAPDGANWTLGAIIKNLEAITGLTGPNTKAIKEMLGLPLPQQYRLIQGIVERLLSKHAPVNDRHNTFEAVMKILGTMGPEQDELIYALSQPLLQEFHTDIQKPYINYVGNNFRTADGSYNSLLFPDVGKAGTNYVRTVTTRTPMNNNLPDPSEVFHRLLKRSEFTPHKGGINMLLFYFAILIIHDLFYSSPKDPKKNLTTSYADQSFLYGFNRTDQESVRQMKGGLLKPDQWFDKRLIIQPPGVAAMVVLFSRNHNYIAEQLLEKNEGGRFSYGPGKTLANEKEQDEELFQTARLINNACHFKIIEQEYARAILGVRQDAYFTLDVLGQPPPPLYGNAVSIEFNATYRWHQALGEEDTVWTDQVIKTLEKPMRDAYASSRKESNKPANSNGEQGTDQSIFESLLPAFNDQFVHASAQELTLGLPIAGLHRESKSGQFSDFDLAKCLRKGYNQIAGEVGNGLKVPASMEHIEIQGILQCRQLRCCSFNDFRRYFNLTPLETFEDFSEIPEVQKALEELYGTPDQVELYAGAMVERCKVTGLRLPYTIGRAILADAINLIRNDRIIAQELIPSNMTNWGYEYSMGKEMGRILPRMITTLLPHSNANGHPAFSEQELATFFLVPGHSPAPPPAPYNGKKSNNGKSKAEK
ncbi:heme peroxidase [Phascolomyces articulosus]|uniref:Heme peroxidase n=1 Tax=Phascolomyces articulosus TaxID=60185 RepID=A0AAD5KAS3_9FUNG|nr:heme peroxidase [Phascolomyces articulosus]